MIVVKKRNKVKPLILDLKCEVFRLLDKGNEVVYDINFSPLILNGIEEIEFEGLTLIIFNNEEEKKVIWNEKNQSNLIYYKNQILLFQNKLNIVENKAVTF